MASALSAGPPRRIAATRSKRMTTLACVAAGGLLGVLARHGVNLAIGRALPHLTVPWATATVNFCGCFAAGIAAGLAANARLPLGAEARMFLFVGLLGGFTTFSTLALDVITLSMAGRAALAVGR
jgi:fluoride exporter